MSEYKVGDVVQLNSGGPLMTVGEVGPGNGNGPMVKCVWFDGSGKPFSDYFMAASVKDRNDTNR